MSYAVAVALESTVSRSRVLSTLQADAEQVERLALQLRRFGDHVEGRCSGQFRLNSVPGDDRQVFEEGAETMHRHAVWCALGGGLAHGRGRGPFRCDDGGARDVRARWVVLVEQDRGELPVHVPLDMVGEHAQQDVGAHALRPIVVDGPHLEVDSLDVLFGTWVAR